MPPTLEKLWLPRGHTDSGISPELVLCLEEAVDKRLNDIRNTQARMPLGTHRNMDFQQAGAADHQLLQEEQQEAGDVEREDDDEVASDEMSDDAEYGNQMVGPEGATADQVMDELEDDSDDVDDDDDLAAYL